MNLSKIAAKMGRNGGKKTSARKAAAARRNGVKGGRRMKITVEFAYTINPADQTNAIDALARSHSLSRIGNSFGGNLASLDYEGTAGNIKHFIQKLDNIGFDVIIINQKNETTETQPHPENYNCGEERQENPGNQSLSIGLWPDES